MLKQSVGGVASGVALRNLEGLKELNNYHFQSYDVAVFEC